MSTINIVIFIIIIFILLLPFFKSSSRPARLMPSLSFSPFLGAQIDDDEKNNDNNENKFNKNYQDINKKIAESKRELDVCIKNRIKINNAIQKLRDDAISNVTSIYNTTQNEANTCSSTLDSRITKYIAAYKSRYGKTLTKQEAINKLVNNQLENE
jgi:hypothetical protein